MKKVIISLALILGLNDCVQSQDYMSTYNLSKNEKREMGASELFPDNPQPRYREKNYRNNRFLKAVGYTGLLAGGLFLAQQSGNQDYYINNTLVYGTGGIMAILATGLVISSINGINKELYVATSGTSVSVVLNL